MELRHIDPEILRARTAPAQEKRQECGVMPDGNLNPRNGGKGGELLGVG